MMIFDLCKEDKESLVEQARAEGFQPSGYYANGICDDVEQSDDDWLAQEIAETRLMRTTFRDGPSKDLDREQAYIEGIRDAVATGVVHMLIEPVDEDLLESASLARDAAKNAARKQIALSGALPREQQLAIDRARGYHQGIVMIVGRSWLFEDPLCSLFDLIKATPKSTFQQILGQWASNLQPFEWEWEDLEKRLELQNETWKPAPMLVDAFLNRFQQGQIPKPFTLSGAFHGLELGPGEITVLGGTPGIGKTAAAMQIVSELRRNHPDLPICIANAESSFDSMLMREIGREMTIPSSKIRRGDLTDEEKAKVVETATKLRDSMKSIEWLSSEFNYVQICAIANKQPGLLVCDYLQKFAPSDQETRVGITMVMSALRQLAASGWAVLALSALNRTTIGQATTLAAFRDSSEIEYQSDAAYVLERMVKDDIEFVRLRCLKNRHDKPADISMDYHAATMEFTERFHEMGEIADNLWGADDDQ